ncbi:hypothetical protein IFR05_015299 [Cadophora sp. M221]|nr:hypothetical protein IFR05_015299 [Cadophora sp. M221]
MLTPWNEHPSAPQFLHLLGLDEAEGTEKALGGKLQIKVASRHRILTDDKWLNDDIIDAFGQAVEEGAARWWAKGTKTPVMAVGVARPQRIVVCNSFLWNTHHGRTAVIFYPLFLQGGSSVVIKPPPGDNVIPDPIPEKEIPGSWPSAEQVESESSSLADKTPDPSTTDTDQRDAVMKEYPARSEIGVLFPYTLLNSSERTDHYC